MPSIQEAKDLSNISDPDDFMRFASRLMNSIATVVDGRLEFDKNFASQTYTVTTPTVANQDFVVNHSLGRTDVNYIVVKKSGSTDIYAGALANQLNALHLRSTQGAITVTLVLY